MAERLHLLPRHRAQIETLLREHLPGVEVWAYGSRVNGRSHDGSDLDLVLRGPGLDKLDASTAGRIHGSVTGLHHSFPGRSARLGSTAGELSPRDREKPRSAGGRIKRGLYLSDPLFLESTALPIDWVC